MSRLPRTLLWIVALLIIAIATLGRPASWAAPVVNNPNQTIPPPKQVTRLPVAISPLINTCDFYLYACNLTADYRGDIWLYDWSPDGHTIAYYVEDDTNSGLYTINEEGKDRRLLLKVRGKTEQIAAIQYSPDGTMIALLVTHPIEGNSIYEMYVYTVANGQTRLLTNSTSDVISDLAPSWSPDGSKLVFVRAQYNNKTQNYNPGDIYTIRPDGRELIRLTNTPLNEYYPIYSPDGASIAYVVSDGMNPSITVMDANGSSPMNLTQKIAPFTNNPIWSLDSNDLFFFAATGNNDWDIYKIGADGSDPVKLTNDALKHSDPVLSPDGNQILSIGRVDFGALEVDFYTMNTDGSNVTKYPNPLGKERHPSDVQWHPDGRCISFTEFATNKINLYLLRLDAELP